MINPDGRKAMQKLLETPDTRMIDLIKDNPKFGNADIEARKAIHKIFTDAPTDPMESFMYYILVNYYSYRYLLNTVAQIEKNLEGKS